MTDRWFRVPETGTGANDNPYRPKYADRCDGFSGNTAHPNGAPHWLVRFYADEQTLNEIASKSDVVELSSVPAQALNQMFGQDRTDGEWNDSFKVK